MELDSQEFELVEDGSRSAPVPNGGDSVPMDGDTGAVLESLDCELDENAKAGESTDPKDERSGEHARSEHPSARKEREDSVEVEADSESGSSAPLRLDEEDQSVEGVTAEISPEAEYGAENTDPAEGAEVASRPPIADEDDDPPDGSSAT